LFLDFDGFEVVDRNRVVVVLNIGSLCDRLLVLLEGVFCADLVFQGFLLGVGEYVVPMLSTDGLFFDGGLLAGGAS
jgi:hypothetical protein